MVGWVGFEDDQNTIQQKSKMTKLEDDQASITKSLNPIHHRFPNTAKLNLSELGTAQTQLAFG